MADEQDVEAMRKRIRQIEARALRKLKEGSWLRMQRTFSEQATEIAPDHFRKLFHRLLEPGPKLYHIAEGSDPWGLVVTRTAITGAQVWYNARKGTLTLGLTTADMRARVPADETPQGAVLEKSAAGWRMYRWDVPRLDERSPPQWQEGSGDVVAAVRGAFDWLRSVRSDI